MRVPLNSSSAFLDVVIFHDYFLLDLFRKWCVASDNLALGDRILDDLYGEGAARRLHAIDGGPDFWEYASEHFPMTEWMARFGHGSVAHSSFYADRLKRCCGGPVAVISPAYDATIGVPIACRTGATVRA